MKKYPRGSEWRKWDLHVHTPASFFWRGGKKLKDLSDDIQQGNLMSEKDLEIKKFIKTVNDSDVDVFCIMDYWTFDWYYELRKYIQRNPGELKKTVFPGMELRVECAVNYRLNIHFILSDLLTDQQLNDFKSELLIRSISRKLSDEALVEFAKSLDESKSRFHGYNKPALLSDKELLELGSKTAEITKESLSAAIKTIPTDSGYVVLPYDTSDGLLGLDWKSHPHDDNYFMQTADIIETRKCENVALFNCVKTESNKDFYDNFNKTICDVPKPCVSGSDAHKYTDYGKYPADKITWIKANPTFEGLKQIIDEPRERVKIQESMPEEKEDYQIIDRVSFVDNEFLPEEILLSQNLTTIIGGKSTGKSVLLRNIANAIDPNEVIRRLSEVDLKEYEKEVDGFKVIWRDGQTNIKNETSEVNKKIIYIPQSYLNRLVDKKEDKTSIDEIIKNVLQQDDEVGKTFEELKVFERGNEKIISKNIDDLFYSMRDYQEQGEIIKSIGDKKGILEQIKKFEQEIGGLKEKVGMTGDQILEYNRLFENINQIKKEKELLESETEKQGELLQSNIFIDPDFSGMPVTSEFLGNEYKKLKDVFKSAWDENICLKMIEVSGLVSAKQVELLAATSEFKPLLEKAKENKALEDKISKLDIEKNKLNLIEKEEKKLSNIKSGYIQALKNLSDAHASFYLNLFKGRAEILKQTIIDGEITFGLDISFRGNAFQKNLINDVFNLQKIGKFTDVTLLDYIHLDQSKFKDDIKKIIIGIIDGKIMLKNNFSNKEAITKLLQNWYIYDYKIKQNGDDISQMSPGKKSFVLLKLLIELDKSRCPILLDQPEDDLDNRSIYQDLVKFIKEKKKGRQIIIATHNPNLVVGSDAECVIIANQKGERTPNEEYQFEYVSGALEDTFTDESCDGILFKKGIKEHACDVLEGGEDAFKKRRDKYSFN